MPIKLQKFIRFYPAAPKKPANGFTLIEMSIVLVIIGLIIGGILVGRDLISASEVTAQISQITKYNSAVNTFKSKYGGLPGDLPAIYANQFGFTPRGSSAGQGDGDGLLEGNCGAGSGINVGVGEALAFWTDLASAKLVDGGFTWGGESGYVGGYSGGDPQGANIDHFLPAAKIGRLNYVNVWSGGWRQVNSKSDGQNYFSLSAYYDIGCGQPGTIANLPPTVAYSIDKKMDDGMPQTGNVLALFVSLNGATWAGGGIPNTCSWINNVPCSPGNPGSNDPTTGGPVVAGDGVSTPAASYTCFDNDGVSGATEHYSLNSLSNSNLNCALSFRFQ